MHIALPRISVRAVPRGIPHRAAQTAVQLFLNGWS